MIRRAALGAFAVVALQVAGMFPASAHTEVVSIDPADGASVPTLPASVELTVDEPAKSANAVLTTPEGQVVPLAVHMDGLKIKGRLPSRGPRGDYVLAYRIVAADGHAVTGSVHFTVVQGLAPNVRRAAPESSREIPLAGLAGGAAALLFVGVMLVLVKVRR